jgi:hypothetical protein
MDVVPSQPRSHLYDSRTYNSQVRHTTDLSSHATAVDRWSSVNTFHRNADCMRWNVNCSAGVPCGEVCQYVNLGSIEVALKHNYAKLGLSYLELVRPDANIDTSTQTDLRIVNFLNNQESNSNKVWEWEMWAALACIHKKKTISMKYWSRTKKHRN